MKNPKIHSSLLALVAGYILFIAYTLYQNWQSGSGDMAPGMFLFLIVLFSLAAGGILWYAWRVWKEDKQKQEEAEKEEQEEERENENKL